jgi:hypothetical protein
MADMPDIAWYAPDGVFKPTFFDISNTVFWQRDHSNH